jgi:predicted phage tail protein
LGEKYGEKWEFDPRATPTVGDALRAIDAHNEEFTRDLLTAHERGIGFSVKFGDKPIQEESDLLFPLGSRDLHLVPVPLSASGQGASIGMIVVGVILVALFWWNPLGWAGGGILWGGVVAGAAMALGGVMGLVMQPASFENEMEEQGYTIGGRLNTARPGDPVPIAIGESLCAGSPVSFDVFADGWGVKDQEGRIVDVISEGPIQGWRVPGVYDARHRYGLAFTYLDETKAIEVPGATVVMNTGTNTQKELPAEWATSRTVRAVGIAMLSGTKYTQTTTGGKKLAGVRLNFGILQLVWNSDTDGPKAGRVQWLVHIKDQGAAGWNTHKVFDVHAKVQSRRNYSIFFPLEGDGPWQIEVTKTSGDTGGKAVSEMAWDSFVEIGERRFSFPNTAVVGLGFQASGVGSGLPRRLYYVKGIKVSVPNNYTSGTRVYAGPWSGTFKPHKEYTNNPAWVWLELLRNPRFGLGSYITDAEIDMWSIYRVAQYCDELVDDGKGGTEPRYTLNGHLRRGRPAWRTLLDLTGSFAALPVWTGRKIGLIQDQPGSVVYQFNPSNVIDGTFSYSSAPLKERTTRAFVKYRNPDDFFEEDGVLIEDRDAMAKFGVRSKDVTAALVTSRGQATRLGRHILRIEAFPETVSFSTGLEGAAMRPGRIFEILDPAKGAERTYGRLKAATATELTLDRDVEIESGITYTVHVALPHKKQIIQAPEDTTTLVLAHDLPNDDFRSVRVWEDVGGDGSFDTVREPNAWDSGTKTLTLTPIAASGTTVPYRVEYPLGVHEAEISNSPGTTRVLTVPSMAQIAEEEAGWILTKPNNQTRIYKVVAVKNTGPSVFAISAILYDEDRTAYVETGYQTSQNPDDTLPLSPRGAEIPQPVGLTATIELMRAPDGSSAPAIVARWGDPPDVQDFGITGYAVSYQPTGSDIVLVPGPISVNEYRIEAPVFGPYTIYVASVRYDGRVGPASKVVIVYERDTVPSLSTKISALEQDGLLGSTVFADRSVTISWRINSGYTEDIPDDPVSDGVLDPMLKDYQVEVFDADTGDFLRVESVDRGTQRYTYSYSNNRIDGPGLLPTRNIRFRVTPRDTLDRLGEGVELTVSNPAPPIPSITIQVGPSVIWPTARGSEGDGDFAGYLCWARPKVDAGDTELGDNELIDDNLVSTASMGPLGPHGDLGFAATAGQTYLLRFAAYDDYSRDPTLLNVTGTYEATAGSILAGGNKTVHDTGTAESGSSTTLVDTDKVWVASEHVGREVEIVNGTGSGQARNITANDATSLTVDPAWETTPAADSQYQIVENAIDGDGTPGTQVINELKVLQASITDALIRSLTADKITAGTVDVLVNLGVGGNLKLDGTGKVIYVDDDQGVPVRRIELGKLGANPEDWGIKVRASDGTLVLGADGLGVAVVSTNNIAFGAVSRGVVGGGSLPMIGNLGSEFIVAIASYTAIGDGDVRWDLKFTAVLIESLNATAIYRFKLNDVTIWSISNSALPLISPHTFDITPNPGAGLTTLKFTQELTVGTPGTIWGASGVRMAALEIAR